MRKNPGSMLLVFTLLLVCFQLYWTGNQAFGQPPQGKLTDVSCNEFMVPKKSVSGKLIGMEDCRMQEVTIIDSSWPEVGKILGVGQDRKYRRLDIGISGSVDGYTVTQGSRAVDFTSAPEFMFVQAGVTEKPVHGVLKYEAAKGSSMTIFYPEDKAAWNGKLYLNVHGAGQSFRKGTLKAWDKYYDMSNPTSEINKLNKLMLVKGYAVAIPRRNSEFQTAGDYSVTLDDGTVLEGRNYTEFPDLVLDFARVAKNILKSRLGKQPSRTYWYGKSAGARLGRLLNYKSGINVDENGKPVVDGIYSDDSGAGVWLPVLYKDGKDVLLRTEKEKGQFVKMIELTHLLYNNERNDPAPDYVSTNFLLNKRKNAELLREKGLENKFRMYEIRGVSHDGGEGLVDQKRGDVEVIPLWHIEDAIIDMLDNWIDKGIEAPPTKSDWKKLGDVNGDGIIENEAVALPEVACPLGVYYQYPPGRPGGSGTTGFARFNGKDLEPLDGRTVRGDGPWYQVVSFVDMNLNGSRDLRETVTEAWQRMGLLKKSETFSREKYAACVKTAVSKLRKENFISEKVGNFYIEQATKGALPDWAR